MTNNESDLLKSDVFKRTTANGPVVSDATYNMLIGLMLSWGFFVNCLIIGFIGPMTIMSLNPWVFLIGYFASCFFGVYLFNSSHEPAISFIGYNFGRAVRAGAEPRRAPL